MLAQVQSVPQSVKKRKIGDVASIWLASALRGADPAAIERSQELVEETALSDSRLSFDGNELAFAADRAVETGSQCFLFRFAPNLTLEAALPRRFEPRADVGFREHLIGHDWRCFSLYPYRRA